MDAPPGGNGSPGPAPSLAPTPTPSKKKMRPLPATPSFQAASLTSLREKAARIQAQLAQLYPNPPIPLTHASPFQLLVAVMLSAQSTDIKVNTVTPELFLRGPNAATMAKLEVSEIEGIIRVLGLAPTKAKNVRAMSQILVEQYGGQVPGSWEGLEALPGVGHKTASVVMSQAFGHPAFPVDTHIHRLAQRWGLSNGKSVEQTEQDLKALLPESTWRDAHLQIIYFGREHCPAQRHDPAACPICSWAAPGAGRSKAGGKAAAAGAPGDSDSDADAAAPGAATPVSRKAAGGNGATAKRRKLKAVTEEGGEGVSSGADRDDEEEVEAEAEKAVGGPTRTRGNGAAKGRAGRGRRQAGASASAGAEAEATAQAESGKFGGTEAAGATAAAAAAGLFDAFRAGGSSRARGPARRGAQQTAAAGTELAADLGEQAREAQTGVGAGGEQAMPAAGPDRRSSRRAAQQEGKAV
ncbi:hypothetical protein HYH02_001405 [Chlamydomonas schloesseri]|uniref:HhH-GPD domain-containing protein n=1 Tax=Chlamydomonas schloesseri TaxID=2026947 RepID=A0A835WVW4_9CHLO|nr:hypothetical protein HYH02_001405 [Chlamydomonas schloesseri]|eukprot:KAG2454382.1 hypothetical protein HYH02_001405 [Chlamydomonas schloesseri]